MPAPEGMLVAPEPLSGVQLLPPGHEVSVTQRHSGKREPAVGDKEV